MAPEGEDKEDEEDEDKEVVLTSLEVGVQTRRKDRTFDSYLYTYGMLDNVLAASSNVETDIDQYITADNLVSLNSPESS